MKIICGRNPGCLPYIIGIVPDKNIYDKTATNVYEISLKHFKDNYKIFTNAEEFEYLLKEED